MIRVKIHNVYHDEWDANDPTVREVEEYIDSDRFTDIRIAKGPKNSPIFVTFEESNLSLRVIKSRCREIIRLFGYCVDGVEPDDLIRDANIRIVPE